MVTADWEDPDPHELISLNSAADWDQLVDLYRRGVANPKPLERCFEVARSNGAACVVVETRYLDLDFRSEFGALFSRAFKAIPDSARRLHFFASPVADGDITSLPDEALRSYLGYMVLRPPGLAPVGRTMLKPPPNLKDARLATVRERVTLFGQYLQVDAVPFMQQDAQLGCCATVATWVCHYSAYRRGEVARQEMADFTLQVDPRLGIGRLRPNPGLTTQQIVELLRVFGMPAIQASMAELDGFSPIFPWTPSKPGPVDAGKDHPGFWDYRVVPLICRYLNSRYALIACGNGHAVAICGYERRPNEPAPERDTALVYQDDAAGPYLVIDNVLNNRLTPWEVVIIPLPTKLWVGGEPVEYDGANELARLADLASQPPNSTNALLSLLHHNNLRLRTYAIPSSDFKNRLPCRGMDDVLVRAYRLARLPRFIWVVEALDRTRRDKGSAHVVGEAIYDSTSSQYDPEILACHVPGIAWIRKTDGSLNGPIACDPKPYETGCPLFV